MKTPFAITLLLLAGFLTSCGPKTDVINNTYSTAEPGNVKGTVQLFDTNGITISDPSGVKVAMEGTSYSTLTTADGTWELLNVPAGTYPSLMYSKAGFPTYKSIRDLLKDTLALQETLEHISSVEEGLNTMEYKFSIKSAIFPSILFCVRLRKILTKSHIMTRLSIRTTLSSSIPWLYPKLKLHFPAVF